MRWQQSSGALCGREEGVEKGLVCWGCQDQRQGWHWRKSNGPDAFYSKRNPVTDGGVCVLEDSLGGEFLQIFLLTSIATSWENGNPPGTNIPVAVLISDGFGRSWDLLNLL